MLPVRGLKLPPRPKKSGRQMILTTVGKLERDATPLEICTELLNDLTSCFMYHQDDLDVCLPQLNLFNDCMNGVAMLRKPSRYVGNPLNFHLNRVWNNNERKKK
ncbi:hypothetical protein H696_01174 [Fonticula alba]|uniref:CHCH domain-containing protein n=1 Tax=Fonticula alba TaxID=691883 RepID=A0A058ZCU5_FONAL|nr:hypothetical protein H696_01174 [Fonticula alba]KCV71753.1 hypothetical protein H696_01174 [Fonticula alba]|eukprot:XP_009493331.1 hypothetical protein H696_01174 [Fonticula alba]